MTDVSDGLVADLGNIADRERGAHRPAGERSCRSRSSSRRSAAALNTDPMTWVLTSGDDYALVATFPKARRPAGRPGPSIGVVSEGSGVRVDGRTWPSGGHEHFR